MTDVWHKSKQHPASMGTKDTVVKPHTIVIKEHHADQKRRTLTDIIPVRSRVNFPKSATAALFVKIVLAGDRHYGHTLEFFNNWTKAIKEQNISKLTSPLRSELAR